jgi:hypothetical protein
MKFPSQGGVTNTPEPEQLSVTTQRDVIMSVYALLSGEEEISPTN